MVKGGGGEDKIVFLLSNTVRINSHKKNSSIPPPGTVRISMNIKTKTNNNFDYKVILTNTHTRTQQTMNVFFVFFRTIKKK